MSDLHLVLVYVAEPRSPSFGTCRTPAPTVGRNVDCNTITVANFQRKTACGQCALEVVLSKLVSGRRGLVAKVSPSLRICIYKAKGEGGAFSWKRFRLLIVNIMQRRLAGHWGGLLVMFWLSVCLSPTWSQSPNKTKPLLTELHLQVNTSEHKQIRFERALSTTTLGATTTITTQERSHTSVFSRTNNVAFLRVVGFWNLQTIFNMHGCATKLRRALFTMPDVTIIIIRSREYLFRLLGGFVHARSPDLFGLFFEEISHAGAGGLYAEMVADRVFYLGRGEINSWRLIPSAGMTSKPPPLVSLLDRWVQIAF
eukprot:1181280-Prorocentrum_minimum.AAC.3